MEQFKELKIGQCVPASFTVNGIMFDLAYPIPFVHVEITKEEFKIEKLGKGSIPTLLMTVVDQRIPQRDINTIRFDVIKHFDGGWGAEHTILHYDFLSVIQITLDNGDVYAFENKNVTVIKEVYEALKESKIKIYDEHRLLDLFAKINPDQSIFEIEAEMMKQLDAISDTFQFIHEQKRRENML